MEKEKMMSEKAAIIAIIAFVLGAAVMFLLNSYVIKPDTVVSIKGHAFSKGELFDKLKGNYGLTAALKEVDNAILKDKYELTDDMKKEIEDQAKGYISEYEMYGYAQEDFLKNYGFETYEDFIEELSNSYRQDLYYSDYLAKKLGEDKIKEFYDSENVYGDINCKHILARTTETVTEEQAKATIAEITDELNAGTSWDEVVEKYNDKIISEDLGYVKFNNELEESFATALRSMENNSYSTEPIKTSYGYHIIYRLDQKDKPSYEIAKRGIARILGMELEENDSYLQYKAMNELEVDYKIKVKDKVLKEQYDEYVKTLTITEE